jgi:hypothetical protein
MDAKTKARLAELEAQIAAGEIPASRVEEVLQRIAKVKLESPASAPRGKAPATTKAAKKIPTASADDAED